MLYEQDITKKYKKNEGRKQYNLPIGPPDATCKWASQDCREDCYQRVCENLPCHHFDDPDMEWNWLYLDATDYTFNVHEWCWDVASHFFMEPLVFTGNEEELF